MKAENDFDLQYGGWNGDSWESEGELSLLINGTMYYFNGITYSEAEKIKYKIDHKYNKGNIIKSIEKLAGKGKRECKEWIPIKIILAEIMSELSKYN